MKNSPITRKIIPACFLCISGVLIGLIGEVVGNDLEAKLNSIGITLNVLYFCLLICTILSISSIIFYERSGIEPNTESRKTSPFVAKIRKERNFLQILQNIFKRLRTLSNNPVTTYIYKFLTSYKTIYGLCGRLFLVFYVVSLILSITYNTYQRISINYYERNVKNCLQNGDYDCAVSTYETLTANYPDNEEYYERLGDIYNYQKKEYSQAFRNYEMYVKTAGKRLYKKSCIKESGSLMGGNPSMETCWDVLDKNHKVKIESVQFKLDTVKQNLR